MFISIRRIISNGWKSFSWNTSLNIVAIFILATVIFLPTFFFLFNPISKILISDIEKKVDISVYFNDNVKPEDIFSVRSAISKIPGVKKVEYFSKKQVLEKFTERHKNNPVLMESLKEIGDNPFLPFLDIKSQKASQYEQIVKFLETSSFKNLINRIDYNKRKGVIDKIFSTISIINKIGVLFFLMLLIIAVLISFNATKMSIDNSKKEISVMRLVGASNWFIVGPFIVQGVIIGIISALIAFFASLGLCWLIDPIIKPIILGTNIFNLYINNICSLILIQLTTGVGLGVISSIIAVKKYLKV